MEHFNQSRNWDRCPSPAYLLSIALCPASQQKGSLGISSGVAWPFLAPVLGGGQVCASLSQLHPPLLSSLCALVPLLLLIFHRGCIISIIPLWTLQVLWLGFDIFTCFPSRNSSLILGCNFLEQANSQPLYQAPCLPPTRDACHSCQTGHIPSLLRTFKWLLVHLPQAPRIPVPSIVNPSLNPGLSSVHLLLEEAAFLLPPKQVHHTLPWGLCMSPDRHMVCLSLFQFSLERP